MRFIPSRFVATALLLCLWAQCTAAQRRRRRRPTTRRRQLRTNNDRELFVPTADMLKVDRAVNQTATTIVQGKRAKVSKSKASASPTFSPTFADSTPSSSTGREPVTSRPAVASPADAEPTVAPGKEAVTTPSPSSVAEPVDTDEPTVAAGIITLSPTPPPLVNTTTTLEGGNNTNDDTVVAPTSGSPMAINTTNPPSSAPFVAPVPTQGPSAAADDEEAPVAPTGNETTTTTTTTLEMRTINMQVTSNQSMLSEQMVRNIVQEYLANNMETAAVVELENEWFALQGQGAFFRWKTVATQVENVTQAHARQVQLFDGVDVTQAGLNEYTEWRAHNLTVVEIYLSGDGDVLDRDRAAIEDNDQAFDSGTNFLLVILAGIAGGGLVLGVVLRYLCATPCLFCLGDDDDDDEKDPIPVTDDAVTAPNTPASHRARSP